VTSLGRGRLWNPRRAIEDHTGVRECGVGLRTQLKIEGEKFDIRDYQTEFIVRRDVFLDSY
jgi:hypothetical protein